MHVAGVIRMLCGSVARRCLIAGLVAVLLATGTVAAESPFGDTWESATTRAETEGKPIVLFSHFAECPDSTPCGAFARVVRHPVSQRRLADVVLAGESFDDVEESSAVAVCTPDGRRLIRWTGIPDVAKFTKVLDAIEGASPHIVASWRARTAGHDDEAIREEVLALLALGYELKARPILDAMREGDDVENRQLASFWIERVDALREGRLPDEDLVVRLTRDGTTERVRFEAWMALGDMRLVARRFDESLRAYDEAIALSGGSSERRPIASESRRRVENLSAPLSGIGLPGSIVTGRRTIRPRFLPEGVARVEYRLDDTLVARTAKPPFVATIGFGRLPKRQSLSVAAFDGAGDRVFETSFVVNDRADTFSVDIVEPRETTLSGLVDVEVVVSVPPGARVGSVVIEWNKDRVALLDRPPWRAQLTVRPDEQGILRAVARLDEGAEIEDVRLINSSSMILESDVHLVEVPAYSEGDSTPGEALSLREDGIERPIDRVIPASDAPLLIGLLVDASWSMTGNMLDVEEAALRFVEQNVRDEDHVMVVGFDTRVRILWPTNDRALIEQAILSLRARGMTSLNDAMIAALLQLQTPGRRRALVVFSDGLDNRSTFTGGDVSEVAKRIGVPIYVLSLRPDPPTGAPGVAMRSARSVFAARTELMRIGWNSGGRAYDMTSLEELESIWSEIGEDLRRQFLVAYTSSPGGGAWRSIEIFDGRKKLRAPSGLAFPDGSVGEEP